MSEVFRPFISWRKSKRKKQAPCEQLPLPGLVREESLETGFAYLIDRRLADAAGVVAAFTERTGGFSNGAYSSMNLGDAVGDDSEAVYRNRRRCMVSLGCKAYLSEFINPRQVHGDEIFVVRESGADISPALSGCDGVVSVISGVPIMLCFADCVPVIAVAPNGAVGVFHAGWRGALLGIVGKGIALLADETGIEPSRFNIYIGPHIGPCCYETSEEILGRFTQKYGSDCECEGTKLDLGAAVTADALGAGAARERICSCGLCTSCNPGRFFSYRASGGFCGRHAAIACAL